jgi:hypothetical protein
MGFLQHHFSNASQMIVFSLTSAHESSDGNAALFRPHPVLTATLNVLPLTVRSCNVAGLSPADARPITLVAMVKANVLNTLLLSVTIFMAVISCLLSSGRQRGRSRPLNLLYWINRASRSCKEQIARRRTGLPFVSFCIRYRSARRDVSITGEHRYSIWSTSMGKLPDSNWPSQSVQTQFT